MIRFPLSARQAGLIGMGLTLLAVCSGCSWFRPSAANFPEGVDPPPRWFNTPSPAGAVGAIGVSDRNVLLGTPERYARRRAIEGLLEYLQVSKSALDKERLEAAVKSERDTLQAGGQTIRLAERSYQRNGLVYSYAGLLSGRQLKRLQRPRSAPMPITPSECEPVWVCNPSTESLGGVIGVSKQASLPSRQYELAFSNAMILLDYAYGVQVEGAEEFLMTKSSAGILRVSQSTIRVDKYGQLPDKVRLHVKGLGFHNSHLYLWIVSPDLPPYEGRGDLSWLHFPAQDGHIGTVGRAKPTVRNLLSDQIHKAFARGVIELASVANVKVDSEILNYQGSSAYFAQRIRSAVDAKLFPSLRGIYLDDNGEVSVWVVSGQAGAMQ